MALDATRPPWLPSEDKLQGVLQNSTELQLTPSDLYADRNAECPLVKKVLEAIVHTLEDKPTEFEMKMAKIHLAIDLQKLLMSWCQIGLEKTMTGSDLKPFFYAEVMTMGNGISSDSHGKKLVDMPVGTKPPEVQHKAKQERRDSQEYGKFSPGLPSPPTIPAKRQLKEESPPRANKISRTGEKSLQCPYYKMDSQMEGHSECVDKVFPNPRKLKEHVWKTTRPFKCHTCGEGFGREKTKAIHCEQRKVKCKRNETSLYEGSPEQHRDRKIEVAKSTQEIIDILEEYNAKKEILSLRPQSPKICVPDPDNLSRSGSPMQEDTGDCPYPSSPRSSTSPTHPYHNRVNQSRLPSPPEEIPESEPATAEKGTSDEGLNPTMPEDSRGHQNLTPFQQESETTQIRIGGDVHRFPSADVYNGNEFYDQNANIDRSQFVNIPKIIITPESIRGPANTVLGQKQRRSSAPPIPAIIPQFPNLEVSAYRSCPTSPIEQPFSQISSYPTHPILDGHYAPLNMPNDTFSSQIQSTNYPNQGLDVDMSQPSSVDIMAHGYGAFPPARIRMKFRGDGGQAY